MSTFKGYSMDRTARQQTQQVEGRRRPPKSENIIVLRPGAKLNQTILIHTRLRATLEKRKIKTWRGESTVMKEDCPESLAEA